MRISDWSSDVCSSDLLRKARKRVVLASYSKGSRDRLQGLLADHGLKRIVLADNWQEALGASKEGSAALAVLPLDPGFTTPDTAVLRSEERRVGKAGVSTCRSRWGRYQ